MRDQWWRSRSESAVASQLESLGNTSMSGIVTTVLTISNRCQANQQLGSSGPASRRSLSACSVCVKAMTAIPKTG